MRELPDAALALGARHELAVVGARDRRVEVAAVFLRDDRVRLGVAALGGQLPALALDRRRGDRLRVLDGEHLTKPIGVRPRHI